MADENKSAKCLIGDEDDASVTILGVRDAVDGPRLHAENYPQVVRMINQELGNSLSMRQVLHSILGILLKIFPQAERGVIVLGTVDGNLVPACIRMRREDAEDTIRLSRALIVRAMRSTQAIVSASAADDARWLMSDAISSLRIRTTMYAPLLNSKQEPIGILETDTGDQRNLFTSGDLELLADVAEQAALAIERARAHEESVPDTQRGTTKQNIFLSYRRDDSIDATDRLYTELIEHFGKDSVFIDVDHIPPGVDFRDHLRSAVNQCGIMLVVIGDQWINATGKDGCKRLEDPSDFVRIEINAALAEQIDMIPVLVGRANMVLEDQLPEPLKPLAFRQAVEVRAGRNYNSYIDHLVRGIEAKLHGGKGKQSPDGNVE